MVIADIVDTAHSIQPSGIGECREKRSGELNFHNLRSRVHRVEYTARMRFATGDRRESRVITPTTFVRTIKRICEGGSRNINRR